MEEGSLVQEALHCMQQQRAAGGSEGGPKNTLVIDIFLLEDQDDDSPVLVFQKLARLAQRLNAWVQQCCVPYWRWHVGGQANLVWGIHVSDEDEGTQPIPHLRATCRYGENVEDEWFAIAVVILLSQLEPNIAVECWDVDDGQILLIESAPVLPTWVTYEVTPNECRHRCWIVNGNILLIKPTATTTTMEKKRQYLTRHEALRILSSSQQRRNQDEAVTSPPDVQQAIRNRVRPFLQFLQQVSSSPNDIPWNLLKPHLHRAAFVVSRPVAYLMKHHPELVHCAILAYCRHVMSEDERDTSLPRATSDASKTTTATVSNPFQDLVWTTHTLGRTTYAMLRTMDDESSTEITPQQYKSIETNRMKRSCQMEATPHLRNALQNGIRLTMGLEAILSSQEAKNLKQDNQDNTNMTVEQRRVVEHWPRIDRECGGNGQWLLEAWQAGPNDAQHDLSDLMRCPVHDAELVSENVACPLTQPGVPLQDQIRTELKRASNKIQRQQHNQQEFDMPPRAEDVDDEAWLELESVEAMDQVMRQVTEKSNPIVQEERALDTNESKSNVQHEVKALNTMLDSFQSFVNTKSDIEGVSHDDDGGAGGKREGNITTATEMSTERDVHINPRVFMNLLHNVLKSSPEELSFSDRPVEQDPYFSKEDYDMLERDDESSEDEEMENVATGLEDVGSMQALMTAMDDELRRSGSAMVLDAPVEDGELAADDSVAVDAHVLSNLLESLDASGGGPGPARNILKEMGVDPPKRESSSQGDHLPLD